MHTCFDANELEMVASNEVSRFQLIIDGCKLYWEIRLLIKQKIIKKANWKKRLNMVKKQFRLINNTIIWRCLQVIVKARDAMRQIGEEDKKHLIGLDLETWVSTTIKANIATLINKGIISLTVTIVIATNLRKHAKLTKYSLKKL